MSLCAVLGRVMLPCFGGVLHRVRVMPVGHVRVMRSLLVIACVMMSSCLAMMLSRMLVMLRRLFVMGCALVR